MLVIISDLHLTDGTSGETIHPGAFRIFRSHLRELAYKASKRSTGVYQPITQIDLVLLGDILDIIRSNKWSMEQPGEPGYVRPWHDPQSPDFINKVSQINEATLTHNAAALGVFKRLSEQGISLPNAKNGYPATNVGDLASSDRVPVKVNIYYLVGNHDWFYHLPGSAYDQIRETVVDRIGLAHSANQPFPHDPTELPALMETYRAHKLFARHGDIYDPINYNIQTGRNSSSLGDVVVVELLNRFPVVVEQELGDKLPTPFLEGLKELDNVRPNIITPIWVNGLMRHCYIEGKLAQQIQEIWNGLADQFLQLDFVREQDGLNPFDEVDKLQFMLKFSQILSFESLSRLLGWAINQKTLAGWIDNLSSGSSYATHAMTEDAFVNRWANYIVYGHTHHHQTVPLDVSRVRGRPFQQLYFNSGTWRQVHDLANVEPRAEEFIGYYVMTYLAFFKADERRGRGFETWSGALS